MKTAHIFVKCFYKYDILLIKTLFCLS